MSKKVLKVHEDLKGQLRKVIKEEFSGHNDKLNLMHKGVVDLNKIVVAQKPADERKNIVTLHDFVTSYGYSLPIKKLDAFMVLNNDLSTKKAVYKKLVSNFVLLFELYFVLHYRVFKSLILF